MTPSQLARGVRPFLVSVALLTHALPLPPRGGSAAQQEHRYLYVAVPGIENDTSHHGVGIVVFDIDHEHKFVRRIPIWPAGDEAESVRGIAAAPSESPSGRLYVSTTRRLGAIDLATERVVWENNYGGHCCDRMAVSPDGRTIYAPAFGSPVWYVIEAASGAVSSTLHVVGWPRNTVYAHTGSLAYLSAWESPVLSVLDPRSHAIAKEVGPFSGFLCPFTINGKETLAFANVDGLVGFEVGDLHTGLILDRVTLDDYAPQEIAEYECPSHGIALTPDERELWVADGVGNRLRIFDSTTYPPVAKSAIDLARQPRWITFSIDGRYAYSSTGDVVDAASKKIVAKLNDEDGGLVESEKMLEVDLAGGKLVRAGEQTAIGAKR
jgi:hypothetical protein